MKIVFLHGLGQDEQSWKDVISYLPNSYSCKSLSLFNHLNSTDTATLDDLTKYIEVQLNQIKEPFIFMWIIFRRCYCFKLSCNSFSMDRLQLTRQKN